MSAEYLPRVDISEDELPVRIDIEGGVSFVDSENHPLFADCSCGIELIDGRKFSTDGLQPIVRRNEKDILLLYQGNETRPDIGWWICSEENGYRMKIFIRNTTDAPLAVETIDVLDVPRGFLEGNDSTIKASMTGWETASPAHAPLQLAEHEYLQLANDKPASRIGPMHLPYDRTTVLLPWMTQISAGDKHALLGFTTAYKQAGFISVDTVDRQRLRVSNYAEGVELLPGEIMRSEQLFLLFEHNEQKALETYAKRVGKDMQANLWDTIPTGWCSWYQFGWDVSEEGIRKNAEVLQLKKDSFPVDYMVVDDGYFRMDEEHRKLFVGDWLEANEKFPGGLKKTADIIHEHGLQAVLWLAPFAAAEE